MVKWVFEVPGPAQPKERARTTFRGGQARTYTPERTRNFEARVALFAQQAGVKPLEGPVVLRVTIVRAWPKSMSKKAKVAQPRPTTRPDGKNVYSAVEDALNGVGFLDDAAVVLGIFEKVYGDAPCVRVLLQKLSTETQFTLEPKGS